VNIFDARNIKVASISDAGNIKVSNIINAKNIDLWNIVDVFGTSTNRVIVIRRETCVSVC